jgi:hypothetical protein
VKKAGIIFILALFSIAVYAQDNVLSLQFSNILFRDLADTIEKTVPVKIYYSDKWVDSLYLKVNSRDEKVEALLDRTLLNTGFSFFITDNGRLIISKGYRIKTNFGNEFREYIRRRVTMPDTIRYAQSSVVDEEAAINEEYKIHRIGIPSELHKSETAVLSGILKDLETGEPVAGAVVYVEKLKAGVGTNSAGYYAIGLPKGQFLVEYRMVGMKTARRNVMIYSNGTLDVGMTPSTNQLDEVTVSASRGNNIREIQTGIENINMRMLKQIPMGMGEADLLKTSLLLPGVNSAGEASAGFNIRGGNVDQNLILFDGAPVINPSHFFGFFSAFNPDIIQDVVLYKSGIPARFGGRISSVMDIILKKGSSEKINVSGGISPFTGRLMVEGPLVKKKCSFIISGRTTYSDWVLGMLNDVRLQKSKAGFNDIQGLLSFSAGSKDDFSISGYLSNDRFDYYEESAMNYSNLSSSLKWDHKFSTGLSSQTSLILSDYEYRLDSRQSPETSNSMKYKLSQKILRTDFLWHPVEKHKLSFGLDATYYSLNPGIQVPLGSYSEIAPKKLEREQAVEPSLYFGDEFEYSPMLTFSGGIRVTMFTALGPDTRYIYAPGVTRSVRSIIDTVYYGRGTILKIYPGIEFRFSSRYIIAPDLSVKAGFQRNFQYLNMISNTISMSPTDIWKLSDNYLKPQRGDQVSLGIYKNFRRKAVETSVEVYYKNIKNIIDYKGGATLMMNEHLETDILNGNGRAYGIELMLKKQSGTLNGWISYTYSRSLVKVDGKYEGEEVNGGKYFPANFDKPHDIKVVGNLKIMRRISLSSNLVYNTGRPITYPVAFYEVDGVTRVFYSERNEFRIPDYLRLDCSATLSGNLKARKLNHSSLVFTVYNVLGRRNPYSIYFKVEDGKVNGYRMSIFGQPVFLLTYNFRIRGNASTDF